MDSPAALLDEVERRVRSMARLFGPVNLTGSPGAMFDRDLMAALAAALRVATEQREAEGRVVEAARRYVRGRETMAEKVLLVALLDAVRALPPTAAPATKETP